MSLGGAQYAVIFVDDFTRIKKLYFMARKSEVPERFQQYIAEVAKPEGLTIQRLRIQECSHESVVSEIGDQAGVLSSVQSSSKWGR